MRLIDTKTLNLQEFIDGTIPKYAILSHTWEPGQEVTLHEMAALDAAGRKNGFSKIRETCRLARRDNIGYAWVDTCCINKDSSAELSEAINSMYDWYAEAAICYAYLSDLEPSETQEGDSPKGLSECRWFTRGWTLVSDAFGLLLYLFLNEIQTASADLERCSKSFSRRITFNFTTETGRSGARRGH